MGVTGEVGGSGSGIRKKKLREERGAQRPTPRHRAGTHGCVSNLGSLIFAGQSSAGAAAAAATRWQAKRTRVSEERRERGRGGASSGGVSSD